jgi:hypothetical protein
MGITALALPMLLTVPAYGTQGLIQKTPQNESAKPA